MIPRDVSKEFLEESGPKTLPANLEHLHPVIDWETHLEQLPLATWICSSDGSGVFINRTCQRLLGIVRIGQIQDDRWVNFIHPDDRKDYLRAWNRFIDSSSARFSSTVRWRRPDTGQTLRLQIRAQRIDSGKFQGWIREDTAEQALSKLEEIAK